MTEEQERVVIRDNRKIDRDVDRNVDSAGDASDDGATVGAQARPVDGGAEPVPEAQVPMVEASLLDERTADLQRLQAEYANYRKRTERDRLVAGEAAVARVLTDLLPVVDDLHRAAEHGDLTGPLKAVADKLEGVTTKLGLVEFGVVGDPFDPSIHEAVAHGESAEVSVATCTTVMRPGYKLHDRLLRAAMVAVSDPTAPAAEISVAEHATAEQATPEHATDEQPVDEQPDADVDPQP